MAGARTKTMSSHVLALLADTVFARVSLSEGWLPRSDMGVR
ncbi:hypothetical protein DOT_3124 [Desulfosporosinus sp. OT]|nr:hypothetical protein DOT_3124 [Desulfosporosinus sp. OT]